MDTQQTLFAMERKFWQSMVDQDTEAALSLLDEPSLMVSSHGTSTWVCKGSKWLCVAHTETPAST